MVVDAAAMVDLLLRNEPEASWVAMQLGAAEGLYVPHLLDAEVASAVRRRTLQGHLSPERGALALSHLRDFRLVRYPLTWLLERVFELRHALSAHDAAYVALAEAFDTPLVTTDEKLARSRGHAAEILTPAS